MLLRMEVATFRLLSWQNVFLLAVKHATDRSVTELKKITTEVNPTHSQHATAFAGCMSIHMHVLTLNERQTAIKCIHDNIRIIRIKSVHVLIERNVFVCDSSTNDCVMPSTNKYACRRKM